MVGEGGRAVGRRRTGRHQDKDERLFDVCSFFLAALLQLALADTLRNISKSRAGAKKKHFYCKINRLSAAEAFVDKWGGSIKHSLEMATQTTTHTHTPASMNTHWLHCNHNHNYKDW